MDTVLDALKNASENVIHKAAEATGQFIGSKITDKIVKPKPVPEVNSRHIEEIIIPSEKGEETLHEPRLVL